MKNQIVRLFLISFLALAFRVEAEMVGSCLIKDKKDTSIITHCETIFEDEGFKTVFGADSSMLATVEELAEQCGSFLQPTGKEWNLNQKCPTDNLVGICHDESGSSVIGRGSLHYYQSYLDSKSKTVAELKDECISYGKIFTSTSSPAEYEEAINAIPSELESHNVLATCIMPWPQNPEGPGKCEQYHEVTATKTLELRKSDCLGDPNSQLLMKKKELNTWSTNGESCPSKFRFAACKSAVVTEYWYEDEAKIGKETMDKEKLASKIECESSGRRYFALD